MRFLVFERDGYRCVYCGRTPNGDGVTLHCDHRVPVAGGGLTTFDNLVTACDQGNLGKGSLTLRDRPGDDSGRRSTWPDDPQKCGFIVSERIVTCLPSLRPVSRRRRPSSPRWRRRVRSDLFCQTDERRLPSGAHAAGPAHPCGNEPPRGANARRTCPAPRRDGAVPADPRRRGRRIRDDQRSSRPRARCISCSLTRPLMSQTRPTQATRTLNWEPQSGLREARRA